MTARRHKSDTRTFSEMTFAEQARSINAQLAILGKAMRAHLRATKVRRRAKQKLIKQAQGLLDRAKSL